MNEVANLAGDGPAAAPKYKVSMVPVISLDTEKQLSIRDIRNEPSIRGAMYTDHVIGVNEHLSWLNQLKQTTQQLAMAVLNKDGIPVGLASLKNIDPLHKTADWGAYISEGARGIGIGTIAAIGMIDQAFHVLALEKLNAEVIEGNAPSLNYHKKIGFVEEGFRKSNVVKQGKRLGVHLLGLEKANWERQRAQIVKNSRLIVDESTVRVQQPPADLQASLSPIDRIEAARARNNLNWMSILRIALERSPDTSKQIVSEIKKIDQEISALTQELIE